MDKYFAHEYADHAFYQTLRKPVFTPHPAVFSIVWPILYCLLAYLFVTHPSMLFMLHLALNFMWTPVFFGMQNVGGGLVVVSLMLVTAAMLIPTLPWSFIIYVAWIGFAFVLNLSIYLLN